MMILGLNSHPGPLPSLVLEIVFKLRDQAESPSAVIVIQLKKFHSSELGM